MNTAKKGLFSLVLHCHLPYVIGHGQWPHGMDWLNEAAAETYIPLIEAFQRLEGEGIRAGVTIGVTPVLTEMLAHERFKDGFSEYLGIKIEAAEENAITFARTGEREMERLARDWSAWYRHIRFQFEDVYGRDLVGQFRALQERGSIEIITCAATHGYLPLLRNDECVRAQIRTGVETYRRHYGRDPRGIWLPECAYRPRYEWKPPVDGEEVKPFLRGGVEEFLDEAGIRYFFVDTHLLKGGKPIGTYLERFQALQQLWDLFRKGNPASEREIERTPYRPYLASSTGGEKLVGIFARDPRTTIQVWSGEHGYPGNGAYLDFHKKHFPGGHRYWRVTSAKSDLADKLRYEPDWIDGILEEQAGHFVELVAGIIAGEQAKGGDETPVVCSPYDGELFGHWWYEGPQWMEKVLRKMHNHPTLRAATAGEAMETAGPTTVVDIPEGSWGEGGYHYIWLNDWNSWTWKHIYEAEEDMVAIARQLGNGDGPAREIVEQMARELLLLESSDWQFLISTWSARDYAEARVAKHFSNFTRLRDLARAVLSGDGINETDRRFLEECRDVNGIFVIDLKHWRDPIALAR